MHAEKAVVRHVHISRTKVRAHYLQWTCQFPGSGPQLAGKPRFAQGAARSCRACGNALPRVFVRCADRPCRSKWPAPCIRERMDISAFPGLAPFLDPIALAIVGGGTALTVVLRTPLRDLGRGVAALTVLGRRGFDAEPLLAQVAAFDRIARRHGLIALDRSVIADPDMAAAVAAIVDGAGPHDVAALLQHRRLARSERHRGAFEMWTGAAAAAPALGMVGTLIGLVLMFTAMRDPATIGGAMAVALLATLYGALLANLVAMPVAVRLKRLSRHETQERVRLEDPLVAIASITPAVPRAVREFAA
jgi:chemotaxis protein MotA